MVFAQPTVGIVFDDCSLRRSKHLANQCKVGWEPEVVEQLYPFLHKAFAAELKAFPNFSELIWVQDEPQNQGAWFQIQHNIFENLSEGQKLAYAGRPASASPAVGYYDKHYAQQKALIETAFSKLKGFILIK